MSARFALAVLVACLWASLAFGQANNSNTWQTPGNETVGAQVQLVPSLSGVAVPANGTPVTGVFTGADTTTASATLAGAQGKTTYICGFNVSGLGATAATIVTPTVATLIGANTFTFTGAFTFALGAAAADVPLTVTFPGCIPANATNTAITVTVPGAAGNTALSINAWGVQL